MKSKLFFISLISLMLASSSAFAQNYTVSCTPDNLAPIITATKAKLLDLLKADTTITDPKVTVSGKVVKTDRVTTTGVKLLEGLVFKVEKNAKNESTASVTGQGTGLACTSDAKLIITLSGKLKPVAPATAIVKFSSKTESMIKVSGSLTKIKIATGG